jgi:hypothetical protein
MSKHRKLQVPVKCSKRRFFLQLNRKRGNAYHIVFRPHPDVTAELGIQRVSQTTGQGIGFETPAIAAAQAIIERYFPDPAGNIAAIAEAEAKKTHREIATLGDITKIYLTQARTVRGKENIKVTTLQANVCALARIVTWHLKTKDAEAWKGVRSDRVLTAKAFESWMQALVAGVPQQELRMDRAKQSANSNLNQARSIFAKDYMPLYADLKLPDLAGLLALKNYPIKTDRTFKAIPPAVLNTMANEINAMRTENPGWYLAFQFHRWLGMRSDEVLSARKLWIRDSAEGPEIAIEKYAYEDGTEFTPKGIEGQLLISPELLADIRELSPARHAMDTLVPITQRSYKAFSKWVGKHLGARRSVKTTHALRAQAISEVFEQNHGNVKRTLKFSRHKDIETLAKHYLADVGGRPMLRREIHVLADPQTKAA